LSNFQEELFATPSQDEMANLDFFDADDCFQPESIPDVNSSSKKKAKKCEEEKFEKITESFDGFANDQDFFKIQSPLKIPP